jgi:hypothetical protein
MESFSLDGEVRIGDWEGMAHTLSTRINSIEGNLVPAQSYQSLRIALTSTSEQRSGLCGTVIYISALLTKTLTDILLFKLSCKLHSKTVCLGIVRLRAETKENFKSQHAWV